MVVSPVRACVIPAAELPDWWWFSRTGEHIGYESRSRSGRRAESKADVVSFAVQRIANPGLVDRFTRGLSLTEPAAATFIPAPLGVTSTTRRLTRWPES